MPNLKQCKKPFTRLRVPTLEIEGEKETGNSIEIVAAFDNVNDGS